MHICADCYNQCESWLLFKTICNDNEHQLTTITAQDESKYRDSGVSMMSPEDLKEEIRYANDDDEWTMKEPDLMPSDGCEKELSLAIEEDEEFRTMEDSNYQLLLSPGSDKENGEPETFLDSLHCPVFQKNQVEFLSKQDIKRHFSQEVRDSAKVLYERKIIFFSLLSPCLNCTQKIKRTSKVPAQILKGYSDDEKVKELSVKDDTFDDDGHEEKKLKAKNTTKSINYCDDCGKSFFRGWNLARHKRNVHNNERTFMCEVCGKGFMSDWALGQHKIKHKIVCQQCDMKFTHTSSLKRHLRRFHNLRT